MSYCFLHSACPSSVPSPCNDGTKCYNEAVSCDGENYCEDGTDESTAVCGVSKYHN